MSDPGWYPDPAGSTRQRYWDGQRWTDALSTGVPTAPGVALTPRSTRWAMAAHLSALVALVIGFVFIGPLIVYVLEKDDPYVRRHAAEALNFNISVTIYALVGALVLGVLILLVVGIILAIPLVLTAGIVWLVLVIVGGIRAGNGEDFRYPLTIRFVS